MTTPFIHTSTDLSTFTEDGSWDALLLIVTEDLSSVPRWLVDPIQEARSIDAALCSGTHMMITEAAPGRRLILSSVGSLDGDCDDVRLFGEAGTRAMKRALEAGAERPCLVVYGGGEGVYLHALESATLGVLSALWCPLEAREQTRGASIEALGVVMNETGREGTFKTETQRAQWARWISAIEAGRSVARDVAGTEPERMAPPKLAELSKRVFRDTSVEVNVIKERATLERDYPLLSAVARASQVVKRHQPCVIRLNYVGEGEIKETLLFAGKGVTYDTGGADIKFGGHMAGMSRDKGGAAAVIGFFLSLAHLKPKHISAVAEIGAVRNSIGADSFVTDEIITSHAGVRVRIGNTDAEGRLVLADLLSHLREEALEATSPRLFTVATLTGHAGRAVGPYSITLDNGPAYDLKVSEQLAQAGERIGDCFEVSRLRREDLAFVKPRTLADDVLSCNNAASSATPRGHQFPMAFLIKASGLSQHGRYAPDPLSYTHIDIGGSGVEGGDWQHGRPTAAPVLAFAARWLLNF